jgi:hypothetical protein
VAKDDEVDQLFYRPLSDQLKRYSQSFEDIDHFDITDLSCKDIDRSLTIDDDENITENNNKFSYNEYITEYNSPLQIVMLQQDTVVALNDLPNARIRTVSIKLVNFISRMRGEEPVMHSNDEILQREFQTIIDEYITPQYSEYRKAC